jgi:hypothetical protein
VKKACAATVATAAAVALAAGMTSPASANGEQTAAAAKSTSLTAKHRITLITGDRVVVDAKGRVVGLERAKGREDIPVQVRKLDGHTLVIPADAARLVATGKLDQRLFDVTELNKSSTRKAQKKGLKVIVGYQGSAAATKADVRDAGTLSHSLKSVNAALPWCRRPRRTRPTCGTRSPTATRPLPASRTSGSTASARPVSTSPSRRSAPPRRGRPATTARA